MVLSNKFKKIFAQFGDGLAAIINFPSQIESFHCTSLHITS